MPAARPLRRAGLGAVRRGPWNRPASEGFMSRLAQARCAARGRVEETEDEEASCGAGALERPGPFRMQHGARRGQ
jgi:hypothetical protein